MTSSPSSTGGPYDHRDVRSLYPSVTDNHLRYLEKWGLLRQGRGPRAEREYSFADLLAIKHVANELDRGTALRVILRGLLAERQGQLELDFHAAPDTPRAKVVALQGRRTAPPAVASAPRLQADTHQSFPFTDPQAALAASTSLGVTTRRRQRSEHGGAAAAYRKALVIDPDLCRRSSTWPTSITRATS
jgi:DNA-binding transcriptional MerR regulator